MNGATKFLISGTILAGGTAASWKAYDEFAPKTVGDWFEWKGIKKISDDKSYRGIFEEHKSYVNSLNTEDLNSSTSTKDAASKIKDWCTNKLNNSFEKGDDWEIIVKFCENKFSKVRGLLASKDEIDFINSDEDYKVSLFFLKHSNDWKTKVKAGNTDPTHEELKTWCNDQLNKEISETDKSLYSGINKFCKVQAINNVEGIIKKNKSDWTMASEDTDWENLFEKWKYTNEFINLLKKQNGNENVSSSTPKEQGKTNLKNWCTSGKNKKLSENLENKFIDYIREACDKSKTNN